MIPICYFPTHVLLTDDNENFLHQLERYLEGVIPGCETSLDPRQSLKKVNDEGYYLTQLSEGFVENRVYEGLATLSNEIHNPDRYKTISTIVVDYDMPEMTGVEFCQQIQSPHIKKILLTGAADERIAVDAFNKGIIDYYIPKHGMRAFDDLEHYIRLSQGRFFQSFYRPLGDLVAADPLGTAITDPIFQKHFAEFIQKEKISEYYLTEAAGSYLCISEDQKIGYFGLLTEDRFNFHEMDLDHLIQHDPTQKVLTDKFIKDIQDRKQVLYFDALVGSDLPPLEKWHHYIAPLQSLKGTNETYYWFYLPNYLGDG